MRNEKIRDYTFEVWIDFWLSEGYDKKQILEMIQLAKEMPKYGGTLLTMGDILSNWKKITERTDHLSLTVFKKYLSDMLETDRRILNQLSLEILGIPFPENSDRDKWYSTLMKVREAVESEYNKCELNKRRSVLEVFSELDRIEEAEKYLTDQIIKILKLIRADLAKQDGQSVKIKPHIIIDKYIKNTAEIVKKELPKRIDI